MGRLMFLGALALLGGAASLGFAPWGAWPVTLVSLSVAFYVISRADTPREAFWRGWGYGLGYFAGAVHFIYIALHDFSGLAAPLTVLVLLALAAFLAIYKGLAAWLAWRLVSGHAGLMRLLALPAGWAVMEWLRGWLFTGFPWLAAGYSQIPDAPLAGYAPVLGIYGVGVLLAWIAGMLAWMGARLLRREFGVPGLAATAVVVSLALVGMGLKRMQWTTPVGEPVRVALLQGGIPQDEKWDEAQFLANRQRYYDLTHDASARLIVMPETAYPIFLHDMPMDDIALLREEAARKSADLIVGIARLDKHSHHYYNAAVVLNDPALPAYYKSHLVPFGEYIPFKFVLDWVYDNLLHIPLVDFSSGGAGQPTLNVAGQKIAANICYEDVFGEELIEGARRSTMLLNISNLAWFDGSGALAQHGQMAQARALEMGRYVLRATNTGTTAVITPDGRYRGKLPERVPGILAGSAQGMTGETPYMRWGNAPALVLMGLLALAGLVFGRRARTHRNWFTASPR
ncbi:apolipoprotein N-acyltransferase [Burkholderiaceae bacterium DAT-1]|nr:apolipoprotein N-acyltransferase [Burkholderiaceae bacterium DAT-1]